MNPSYLPGYSRKFLQQITGRFLLPHDNFGQTGGSSNTNQTWLSINRIPSHNHSMNSAGDHSHGSNVRVISGSPTSGWIGYIADA